MRPPKAHSWLNHRYYSIGAYFQKHFGEKVSKISVSVAETCPNREAGRERCIFCDEWGSAAYHNESDKPLSEQIRIHRSEIEKRYKAKKYLIYFQAYTNTFADTDTLKQYFETALKEPDVVGIAIGTRPDSMTPEIYSLFKQFSERSYLLVELGAQSLFDARLEFLRRGHTAAQTIEAVRILHEDAGVHVGLHLMFGLPEETDEEIVATARRVNELGVSNVKLHNLHVLAKTPLAKLYEEGAFRPLELDEYAEKVVLFLRHLSPEIAVQRLSAVCSYWDELVAPEWTKKRMHPAQYIEDVMRREGAFQGDRC